MVVNAPSRSIAVDTVDQGEGERTLKRLDFSAWSRPIKAGGQCHDKAQ